MNSVDAGKHVACSDDGLIFTNLRVAISISVCMVLALFFMLSMPAPATPVLQFMVKQVQALSGVGLVVAFVFTAFTTTAEQKLAILSKVAALMAGAQWFIGSYGDGLYQAAINDPVKAIVYVLALQMAMLFVGVGVYFTKTAKPVTF